MSLWFRHYAGMMRDEKLVAAAVRSKQPVERVIWVWGAILESATEIEDAGRYEFASDEAAYFLRCEVDSINAILAALETAGRIGGGVVVKWGDRQFQSDTSKERQKRYRDKLKGKSDVTPLSPRRDVTLQEQEAEQERKIEPIAQQSVAARAALSHEDIRNKLLEANGTNPQRMEMAQRGLVDIAFVQGLIAKGYDFELDILASIRSKPKPDARHWRYFEAQIAEYRRARLGADVAPAAPDPRNTVAAWPLEKWRPLVERFRVTGDWNRDALGPKPGDPDCRAPPELINGLAA